MAKGTNPMLLRRADVVDGAVKLLDAEGLDGLTTRKLGAALNVQGPALYRHFPSKEALLDAIADRLVEGLGDPLPDGIWYEQLTVIAGRMREALLAHRDGARVVAGTFVTGGNTLLSARVIFGILEKAGFPAQRAGWIVFALGYYVLGHTIEEQAQADLVKAGTWPVKLAAISERSDPGYMEAAAAATFTADPAERFAYGLRAFLDGIGRDLLPHFGDDLTDGGEITGPGEPRVIETQAGRARLQQRPRLSAEIGAHSPVNDDRRARDGGQRRGGP
jgi:TetR/AcrR family transcriptional regulator, tetracycline repressor protein